MTGSLNSLQELRRLGQSVWFDNIRRGFIKSGELQQLIDQGVTGLTSNPTIFEKAISGSTDYDDALLMLARDGKNAEEIFEALAMEDIRDVADLLRPIYDETEGVDGYASIEVSPHLARKTDETIAEARRLFAALDRPNVMIKVPGTPEGVPAIRRLISEGINVNVTLIFGVATYEKVAEAYIRGLESRKAAGQPLQGVASVASFFISRIDAAIDADLPPD
ncbi:MAG: transaldolase, partial [Chloroflexi bacterium]|nr:transaldolase [Chloroflexota bacterium]